MLLTKPAKPQSRLQPREQQHEPPCTLGHRRLDNDTSCKGLPAIRSDNRGSHSRLSSSLTLSSGASPRKPKPRQAWRSRALSNPSAGFSRHLPCITRETSTPHHPFRRRVALRGGLVSFVSGELIPIHPSCNACGWTLATQRAFTQDMCPWP